MSCKLGFNQNCYTLTLILLMKILLCSKLPWTKFVNYKCFVMKSAGSVLPACVQTQPRWGSLRGGRVGIYTSLSLSPPLSLSISLSLSLHVQLVRLLRIFAADLHSKHLLVTPNPPLDLHSKRLLVASCASSTQRASIGFL